MRSVTVTDSEPVSREPRTRPRSAYANVRAPPPSSIGNLPSNVSPKRPVRESGAASVPGAYDGVGALSRHLGAEGCVTADGTDGVAGPCRAGRGLDEINQVVISPGGRYLYSVANQNAHAIGVFAIDQGNGALTQLSGTDGCISDTGTDGTGGACADGRGLNEAGHLAISPEGKHVYASAAGDDLTEEGALAIFSRDATTGVLTQLAGTAGCIRQTAADGDGCAVGRGLAEPTSVTVSPPGRSASASTAGPSRRWSQARGPRQLPP